MDGVCLFKAEPEALCGKPLLWLAVRWRIQDTWAGLRRQDTPLFVVNAQLQVLQTLSKEKDPSQLTSLLPEVLSMLRERVSALYNRKLSLNELLVTQTLSRELGEYRVSSPVRVRQVNCKPLGRMFEWDKEFSFFTPGQNRVCKHGICLDLSILL